MWDKEFDGNHKSHFIKAIHIGVVSCEFRTAHHLNFFFFCCYCRIRRNFMNGIIWIFLVTIIFIHVHSLTWICPNEIHEKQWEENDKKESVACTVHDRCCNLAQFLQADVRWADVHDSSTNQDALSTGLVHSQKNIPRCSSLVSIIGNRARADVLLYRYKNPL